MGSVMRFSIVAVVALLLAVACQTVPRSKGRPPWAGLNEPPVRAIFTEQATVPDPLACDGVLYFTTVVSERPVNCETFDFRPLLLKALDLRAARLASLRCPQACARKDSWVFSRIRRCRDGEAFLSMRSAVGCRAAGDPPPPGGIGLPGPTPWSGEDDEQKDAPSRQDWSEEVREYGPRKTSCATPPEVARYDAYFPNRACSTIANFAPFVAAAEARAAEYHALIACGPECMKQAFSADYVTWECVPGGNDVLVKVYWRPCLQ